MTRLYHVSSSHNRDSIKAHGLDWSFMTTAPGIAGSREPEVAGVFVCLDKFTVDFFVRVNNTGGPVDVWAIDNVDQSNLRETASGFSYLPARIGADHLTLIDRSLHPVTQDDDESSTPNRLRRPGHDGEQAMTGDSHDG